MKICFATHNPNKLDEVKKQTQGLLDIVSLDEIGCTEEIPEEGTTLEQNSLIKALYVKDNFDLDCFAEDSGLIVDALDGAPGVYSARYAGEPRDHEANIQLLLTNMQGKNIRTARYKAVTTLVFDGRIKQFEGTVEGQIIQEKRGNGGFGYDPVFIPKGYEQTFAELPLSVKQEIGHRGQVMRQLVAFLKEHFSNQ